MDSLDLIRSANLHAAVNDPDVAHLVVGLNEVLSSRTVPGLDVRAEPGPDGVTIRLRVAAGTVVARPVHLCFGLLQAAGVQKIDIDLQAEEDAAVAILAHCVFPNARDVRHEMAARIHVGPRARYEYTERHIHSPAGGVVVLPRAEVRLDEGARFRTDFELIEGRVGRIEIDYEAACGPGSVLDMSARVSGRGDDRIAIRETAHLAGEGARGVLTSRVAVREHACAEVYNKLTATAAGARGHVDCKEIVQGDGTVSAVPVVEVRHPKAHVTHEAALGSVDTKQLQTLMARGLTEDQAADLVIAGLLS
jgi:hypothetical protein